MNNKLTPERIALIGVTQLTIRNWELGNYKPTPERLPAIEEAKEDWNFD